jgi:hypothetical protein
MSTNPNLITLLKKTSTINLEVTNSTYFIFTQPLLLEDDYALNIGFSRMYYFSIYLISVGMNLDKASITI